MSKVGPEHIVSSHFSGESWRNLTLEPLRSDGLDALSLQGIEGILKIVLRELEIAWDNALHEVTIRRSDNLFAGARGGHSSPDLIPPAATLVRASFDLQFTDQDKPTTMHIRPPYTLKFDPPCDPRLALALLEKRGFRLPRNLAKTLVIFAFVLTNICSPLLDTGDSDDDDDDHHHYTLVARR